MKNILLLMFLFFLVSACSSNSEESGRHDGGLTITQDTVMVDAGEEFLYLKTNLYHSVVSEDGKFLYNFDSDRFRMEKIDLDELKYVSAHPFEKEGPNGVGNLYRVFNAPQGEYLLLGFGDGGIFDLDGEKKRDVRIKPGQLSGDELKVNELLFSGAISTHNSDHLYGSFSNFSEKVFYIGLVDIGKNEFRKFQLPEQEYQKDYFFNLRHDRGMIMMGPNYFVDFVNDKLFISNSLDNSIHVYQPEEDRLERYVVDHQLFAHRKTGKYSSSSESNENFSKVMNEYQSEINYMQPIWDAEKERFYRFSYQTETTQDAEGKDVKKNKVFLSSFTEDMKLLGETELVDYHKTPAKHFIKDGKIWVFENVDDELGFVRLTVE